MKNHGFSKFYWGEGLRFNYSTAGVYIYNLDSTKFSLFETKLENIKNRDHLHLGLSFQLKANIRIYFLRVSEPLIYFCTP